MRKIALFLLLFGTTSLQGEIVEVRVDWNNIQCRQDCAKLLDRNFLNMKQAAEVSVDAGSGVATIKWKANTKFDYFPIKAAFARVGITMNSLRLTVRGTITHTQNKFYITSIGDGTKFHLISTIHPSGNNFEPTNSPFNRPLTQQQRNQLLEAEKTKSVVTITGPILNVNQFPPLDLITQSIVISTSKS